jgi:hypothetical protein
MIMQRKYYYVALFICLTGFFACEKSDYEVPEGGKELQNNCIKRSLGPNIAGGKIEFAYAMALSPTQGKLVSAKVEASIPGDVGTYLENKSYHTNASGQDIGIEVGNPSVTEGKVTEEVYSVDTCAATLRYYYVIPEAAKGKEVSFTFSATDSHGKTVTFKMGPYTVSQMDMKLDIVLGNNSYFSIADMAVYDATFAAANPDKIDLVYLYRSLRGVKFLHALVSPAADSEYLPDITLPDGVNNSTRLLKVFASADQQLARDQFGVFVDDLDLQKIDLSKAPNYGINIAQNAGAWLETADGQYRAYIYVNKADEKRAGMTFSIKRLKVK